MKISKRWLIASTLGFATALPGCSWSGGWLAGRKSDNAAPTAVASRSSWLPVTPQAQRGSGAGGIGSAVNEALTVAPKVTPPDDPISLASKPAHVGAEVYVQAASLCEMKGNAEAAWQQYRKALEAGPKDPATLAAAAMFCDRQGKTDDAFSLYQLALAAAPQDAKLHNNLALCCARHGKPDEAIKQLSEAVRLQPENTLYRNNLAAVYLEAGRTAEALEQFTAAHGDAAANYNVGLLLSRRGQTQLAEEHLRRAVELDPQLAAAVEQLRNPTLVAQRPAIAPAAASGIAPQPTPGPAASSPANTTASRDHAFAPARRPSASPPTRKSDADLTLEIEVPPVGAAAPEKLPAVE